MADTDTSSTDATPFDYGALVKTATSGGADTSYVKPEIDKLRAIGAERDKSTDAALADMKTEFGKDKAEVAAKKPAPVDVQPWSQKPPETNPVEAFGSFASVFGLIASAFTHQPWQNSMNAAAAAVTALKANDREAYKDAYDAWKTNTDLMLKRHDEQYKDYSAAMEMMKTDAAEGRAMLAAQSAKYGDEIQGVLNESSLYGKLGDAQKSRQDAALRILEVMPKIEEMHGQATALHELQAAREELQQTMKVGDPAQQDEARQRVAAAEQNIRDIAAAKNPYLASSTGRSPQSAVLEDFRKQYRDSHAGQDPPAELEQKFLAGARSSGSMAGERAKAVEEAMTTDPKLSRAEAIRQVDSKSYLSGASLQKIGQNITSVKDGLDAIQDARTAMSKVFAPTGALARYAALPLEKVLTTLHADDPNRQMLEGYLARIKNTALREIGQVGGVQLREQYADASKIVDFGAPPLTVLKQLDKLSDIFQHHLSIAENTLSTGRIDPKIYAIDGGDAAPAASGAPAANDPLGLR